MKSQKKSDLIISNDANQPDISQRVWQIRQEYHNGNNRKFSEKCGIDEATMSKICTGTRGIGKKLIDKILIAYPDINAKWLYFGEGAMLSNDIDVDANHGGNTAVGNANHQSIGAAPADLSSLIGSVATLTQAVADLTAANARLTDLLVTSQRK